MAFGPGLAAETMLFRAGLIDDNYRFFSSQRSVGLMDSDETDFETFRACLVDLRGQSADARLSADVAIF